MKDITTERLNTNIPLPCFCGHRKFYWDEFTYNPIDHSMIARCHNHLYKITVDFYNEAWPIKPLPSIAEMETKIYGSISDSGVNVGSKYYK